MHLKTAMAHCVREEDPNIAKDSVNRNLILKKRDDFEDQ